MVCHLYFISGITARAADLRSRRATPSVPLIVSLPPTTRRRSLPESHVFPSLGGLWVFAICKDRVRSIPRLLLDRPRSVRLGTIARLVRKTRWLGHVPQTRNGAPETWTANVNGAAPRWSRGAVYETHDPPSLGINRARPDVIAGRRLEGRHARLNHRERQGRWYYSDTDLRAVRRPWGRLLRGSLPSRPVHRGVTRALRRVDGPTGRDLRCSEFHRRGGRQALLAAARRQWWRRVRKHLQF
jgi:hypothetical protein